MADSVRLKYLVTPEWDKSAAGKAISDATALYRQLSKMKVEWGNISKQASANVGELRNISAAAQQFGKALSGAAKTSFKELQGMGESLDDLTQQAEGLAAQYRAAKTTSARKHLSTEIDKISKRMAGLNKDIENHGKIYQKHGKELLKITSFVSKFKGEKFDFKGIFDSIGTGLRRGGGKGLASAIKGAVGGIGKGVAGKAARGIAAGGGAGAAGGLAKALPMLAKAAVPIGLVATALTALWKVLAGASEHMTKLNKTLVQNIGTASDFMSSSDSYRSTIDELRHATIGAAHGLLQYGLTSKDAAEALNEFAKEGVGSLTNLHDEMLIFGKGDLNRGVERFTANAFAYGKALGMQTKDVAGMMGKFMTEVGIGADSIQDTMKNVVAAAATANMPMTKFMSIFRQVLPDVELYQNRLEELTGTIKLLSRAMSPRDVKRFMDAFAKGFKGMGFKQRLKTTLIAGVGFVSKTLDKDFSNKARVMAKNFERYGIKSEEFMEAFKSGESGMARLIAKAKGIAAREHKKQISGTEIGEAMKLASYEQTRQKGGALNLATAMRAAGLYGTYTILKEMGGTLTKGFDGLSEHVMHQLGISDKQYEALRTTAKTLKAQRAELKRYGKTTSKSMNAALVQAIAQTKTIKGKKIKESDVTLKDMQNATDEQLFLAADISNRMKASGDVELTAKALAQEQVDATLSISEKIDNVLAFILEKIYKVLEPLLKVLNGIWRWIIGDKDEMQQAGAIVKNMGRMQKGLTAGGTKEAKAFYKGITDAMIRSAQAGEVGAGEQAAAAGKVMEQALGGEQIAKYYGKGDTGTEQKRGADIAKWLIGQGVKGRTVKTGKMIQIPGGGRHPQLKEEEITQSASQVAAGMAKEITTALQNQDWEKLGKLLEPVAKASGRTVSDIMAGFAQDMAKSNMKWTKGWKKGGRPMRRKITAKEAKKYLSKSRVLKADQAKVESADLEEKMFEIQPGQAGKKALESGIQTVEEVNEARKRAIKEGKPVSAAAPGGAPGAKVAADTADATEEGVDATKDQTEVVVKTIDNTNQELQDISGMLRSGISLDEGFMSGTFKKTIADATLESLRTALLEHAILLVKSMAETSDFGATFGGAMGKKVAAIGTEALLSAPAAGGGKFWGAHDIVVNPAKKEEKEEGKGKEKQSGGSIAATGPFYLHKGERVLSPAEAAAYERKGGVGGSTYIMNIHGAGMSVQEMSNVAKMTFDRMSRKQ